MTDLVTAIMIKNMARETVRRMSAKAKNAMRGVEITYQTDDGKTGSYRMNTSINGTDEEIKAYFRVGSKINIGDGPRGRMATIKSVKVLNSIAKNASRLRGIYKDKNEAQARVDRENAKKENENEIHKIEEVSDEYHIVADKKR